MRILLINPPMTFNIGGNLPEYVNGSRGNIPPLGLLYVAAALEAAEHHVQVVDMMAGESLDQSQGTPDLVGITTTTFTLLDALDTAKAVKERWNAPVMLGGIHPTIYPAETLAQENVDYVFVGEADEVLAKGIRSPRHIKGVTFGNPVDVEKLPYPARHLVDNKRYNSVLGGNGSIATMFTSRGCPYGCVFCHRETMGRKFRARTPRQVVDEMRHIKAQGIDEVLIYDDTFTVDNERVYAICDLLIKYRIGMAFDIRARVDTVNGFMLDRLAEAGCKRIHYGVEASSDRVLRTLGKGISIAQVDRVFPMTKEAGIETLAYFIIGSPGEQEEDVEQTIRYARELAPDYCHFAMMTPYPATPLYDQGLDDLRYPDYWRYFAQVPSQGFSAPHWPGLGEEALQKMLRKAYKSFYWRPGRIARELLKTPPNQLAKKAIGALRLIGGKR